MKPNGNGLYIVKINNSCNANCIFCADSIEERQKEGPSFTALVSDLKMNRQSFEDVIISGGEPTIYRHLFEYLGSARTLHYRHVSISTNGFMLSYPRFTQELISKGVGQFVFSFQTIDSKKYEIITRMRKSFALVTKGMENVQRYGGQVAINIVMHKLNYTELPEIVNYLINYGAYNIQLSFMNPIGSSVKDGHSTMAIRLTDVMPYIQKCFDIAENRRFKNLFVENIPICALGRYADRSTDLKKRDVNREYYCACKTKLERCTGCIHFTQCDGTWSQYYTQFGDAEFQPCAPESKAIPTHLEDTPRTCTLPGPPEQRDLIYPRKYRGHEQILRVYFAEIISTRAGFKPASILYVKKSELPSAMSLIMKAGIFHEISDYAYLRTPEDIVRVHKQCSDESIFSIYISKKRELCSLLKRLDWQFQVQKKDNAVKIGTLMGYPSCCITFLGNLFRQGEYSTWAETIHSEYDYETVYRIAPLQQSSRISYLLNNFNTDIPYPCKFFVCNYDCHQAKKWVLRVFECLKKEHIQYQGIEAAMKMPLVYFGADKYVVFSSVCSEGEFHHYTEPHAHNVAEEVRTLFEHGECFTIRDDIIEVYQRGCVKGTMKKQDKYHGVLITFS